MAAVGIAQADYYVARNGVNTDTPPFTSWSTAASNIQDAVTAATNGATVWVEAGTYTLPPNAINYLGSNVVYITKSLSLRSVSGNPADTIIDGAGTNRGIAVVYTTEEGFTLDGFTIANCFATNQGGGISVDASWPRLHINNCIIRDNIVAPGTTSLGGGLYAYRANPFSVLMTDCTLRNNKALSHESDPKVWGEGGGAYINTANVGSTAGSGGYFVNSLFESNSAARGGGINFRQSGANQFNLTNCVFRSNRASPGVDAGYGGGAIHNWPGGVRMWNCLLVGNYAATSGGGIYNQKTQVPLEMYNCTVVSNSSPSGSYGAGVHCRSGTDCVLMYNCIVRSNSAIEVFLGGTSVSHFVHSSVSTNNYTGIRGLTPPALPAYVWGPNSITNDPKFVDFAGRDFRLAKDSPCFNTGTNQTWMTRAVDLDGNPRIDRIIGQVDMGCYERIYQGLLITIR